MGLTRREALSAYARMMNTSNADVLEPLLAEDFVYESQAVFGGLESKQAYLDYIRPKLQTIQASGAAVFAEMGEIDAYDGHQPCVVLAQNTAENLVSFVIAKVNADKITRLDLCIVPFPGTAKRSGEYPA